MSIYFIQLAGLVVDCI